MCYDTTSMTVFVNPLPDITITTAKDSICPGEITHLAAAGASAYIWSAFPDDPDLAAQSTLPGINVSPGTDVLYTVTGTDANSCVNTASQLIVIKPNPIADFSISNLSPCIEQFSGITFTGNATSVAQFHWDFSGGAAYGSNMGPYQVNWSQSGTKIISLYVEQQGCRSETVVDSLDVIPRPTALFTPDITSGCPPFTVQFEDYSTNVTPGSQYDWYFGTGDHSIETNPSFIYNESGVYDVTLIVSNLYGCNDTLRQEALIHAFPIPIAEMDYFPVQVSIFEPTITFMDRSIGDMAKWHWDFGDGLTGEESYLTHTYADTGIFQVSLIIENTYGCTDTTFGQVWIRPDNTLYFPNAFTPNNDNHNDVYRAFGTNIKEFHMQIFTRWGELVFSSDKMENGWDGKYKGDIALTGVYTVIVSYRDALGGKHSYYGKVSLVR